MKNEIKTGNILLKNNTATGSGGIGVEIHNNSDNNPYSGLNEQSLISAVPYIVHESAMTRGERHVKRLVVALIISIATLFLSNIAWLMYISQYDFETTEISSEGGGNANYIGEDGNIYNGTYQG